MFDLSDVDFMKNSIEETEDWTGEIITIYTISGTTGTTSSLEPKTITWNTNDIKANIERISAKEINESGGIYKQDDLIVYSSGSFSEDAKIIYRSGTYNVLEKPIFTCIDGQDIRNKTVIRRAV